MKRNLKDCIDINMLSAEEIGMNRDEINKLSTKAIVVTYDFGDIDDMTIEEADEHCEKVDQELNNLDRDMKDKGYRIVFDDDGCGGGFFYGSLVYDK